MEHKILTVEQITEAIKVLTETVKVNNCIFGSEKTMQDANDKIRELIKLL